MVQTALHLKPISNKTIVLTGALEPALFKTSDAVFNIGCALAAVQILGAGGLYRHERGGIRRRQGQEESGNKPFRGDRPALMQMPLVHEIVLSLDGVEDIGPV